jgi:Putative zinc- or iron-chelating domain
MPVNESYLNLRRDALELNESASEYCLCKAVGSSCCVPNLSMLPEDQQMILEAVARGAISVETLRRAKDRVQDKNLDRCPFLGDSGECTIYEHRPVVCIQHGNGGLPKDKATALRAMNKPGKRTIRISDLEQFSCTACAAQIDDSKRIPLSVVGKSVAILVTIQQGERHYGKHRMNEFITTHFSDV